MTTPLTTFEQELIARVEELEDQAAFQNDPLDPGSYAHTVRLLEARVRQLENGIRDALTTGDDPFTVLEHVLATDSTGGSDA